MFPSKKRFNSAVCRSYFLNYFCLSNLLAFFSVFLRFSRFFLFLLGIFISILHFLKPKNAAFGAQILLLVYFMTRIFL